MDTGKKQLSGGGLSGPLLCWDIFIEGYNRNLQLAGDSFELKKLAEKQNWRHEFDFDQQLFYLRHSILVTDAALQIVYASSGIYYMNGFTADELIGNSPKIFQGPGTSAETKTMIRKAIAAHLPFKATLVNYQKTGVPYNCYIEGYPVFNPVKKLVNFIAFENLV